MLPQISSAEFSRVQQREVHQQQVKGKKSKDLSFSKSPGLQGWGFLQCLKYAAVSAWCKSNCFLTQPFYSQCSATAMSSKVLLLLLCDSCRGYWRDRKIVELFPWATLRMVKSNSQAPEHQQGSHEHYSKARSPRQQPKLWVWKGSQDQINTCLSATKCRFTYLSTKAASVTLCISANYI